MKKWHKKQKPIYEFLGGTVVGGSELVNFQTGNSKTVFTLVDKDGVTHQCVYWAVSLVEDGEKVMTKGTHKNGVFLIQSLIRNYELRDK